MEEEESEMTETVTTPDSFRFFKTFYEASKMIGDDKARLRFYDAISEYVFLRTPPSFLGDESVEGRMLNMAWLLVKPVVDKSIGNSNGGRNSGGERPRMRGNHNARNQHENNSQTTVKQQSINTDKERDKDKGVGENRRSKFVPPTLADVSDYVREKGYAIDPEVFIAFYQANGWKIGKSAMKDWKAAVLTWVKRDKHESMQTSLYTPDVQPRKFMTADELGL